MTRRFVPLENPSAFRVMAAGMWRAPNDPTIYGSLDVDATKALSLIEKYRSEKGVKLTITHLVARAVALALARHPEANCKVRFWGKLERRRTVDVFLTVASEGGRDLSGTRVDGADEKSLVEIATELADKAAKIRAGKDASYEKSRRTFRSLPWWLARGAIGISTFLTNELHLDLSSQGMPVDAFGSAMVTNVGMFGIDTAFAPFNPLARVPLIVLVTEVRDRPWAEAGKVVVRPVLRLCATFDHRILDGHLSGLLSREVSELLTHPERLEAPGARQEATRSPERTASPR